MAKLTWAWPFGYDDFATAATETTWGFHDIAPITLAIQFDAAAAEWTATYWTPAELAFNAAEAGVPPITGTAAVTQAAGSFSTSGVEIFVGSAAVTQARGTIAAAGALRFGGAAAVTQPAGTITASGAVSAPALVIGGIGGLMAVWRIVDQVVVGRGRVRQPVAAIAARGRVRQRVTGTVGARQLTDELAGAGRVKNRVRGQVAFTDRGDTSVSVVGVGRVVAHIRGTAMITQPAPALTIQASASWFEDEEETLLLGVTDN